MAKDLDYDPTEHSPEQYARLRADMDAEFGMPSRPYTGGPIANAVNRHHYERERDMNNEFGWGRTTDADLRRKWNQ